MEALLLMVILVLLTVLFPDVVASIFMVVSILLIVGLFCVGIAESFFNLIPVKNESAYPIIDRKRKRIILNSNRFGGKVLERDQEGALVVNLYNLQSGFTMMRGVANVIACVETRPAQLGEQKLFLKHFPTNA